MVHLSHISVVFNIFTPDILLNIIGVLTQRPLNNVLKSSMDSQMNF